MEIKARIFNGEEEGGHAAKVHKVPPNRPAGGRHEFIMIHVTADITGSGFPKKAGRPSPRTCGASGYGSFPPRPPFLFSFSADVKIIIEGEV